MRRPNPIPRRLTPLGLAFASAFLLGGCTDTTPVAPSATRPTASVAAELPTVTAIGNIIGYGVNDLGTIVGPSDGNKSSAYFWDASTGLKLLGTGGIAWDVSGMDARSAARTRQTSRCCGSPRL